MTYRINGNAVAPGSVTAGSLKPEVLIPAFAAEIKRLSTTRPKIVFEAECWIEGPASYYENVLGECVEPAGGTPEEFHEAYAPSIVYDLFVHLGNMAPPGLAFHNKLNRDLDQADYGWWEEEE